MSYWDFNNTCGLKGAPSTLDQTPDGRMVIVKDPDNPAVLEDNFIIEALQRSRIARADFNRIYPTLLPEEQDRLAEIVMSIPRLRKLMNDDTDWFDKVQSKTLRAGVRTRMPKK